MLADNGFEMPTDEEIVFAFKEKVIPTEVIELIQQPDED